MQDLNQTHYQFLNLHCRICKERLNKGQKGQQTVTSYNISGKLEDQDKNYVLFKDVLLELWQFKLDTTHDDPDIHPSKFCKCCYTLIRDCILDPKKTIRLDLHSITFEPHNEDIMSCDICKLHTGSTSRRGRPPKPKRGRRKNDPAVVCDGTRVVNVVHAYALKVDDEPSPTIQLAKQILQGKSACRRESLSTSESTALSSHNSSPEHTPLSSPVEGLTSFSHEEVVSLSTNSTNNTNNEEASGGVLDGSIDCNLGTTPRLPRKTRGPGRFKTPMAELKSNYSRNRRLQPIITCLSDTLNQNHEQLKDIWPYLEKALGMQEIHPEPSPIQSLAFKVVGGFTDTQYKFIYFNSLKTSMQNRKIPQIYAPITAVRSVEVELKPGFTKFQLYPEDNDVFPSENHLSESDRCSPIDIMEGISSQLCTVPPNMVGVRYRYDKAVAQTLSEMCTHVSNALNDLSEQNAAVSAVIGEGVILDAHFKDGADGLGDINRYKSKTLRALPNNALRYAFSLMEISFRCGGEKHVLYRNDTPNSVKSCRTLLNAIADENDSVVSAMCLLPIEREKMALQGKVIKFLNPSQPHSFRVHIYTTMVDEKYERHFAGLDPSSSNFACTSCTYNRARDTNVIAKVPNDMRRNRADTQAKALERKDNEHHHTREQKDAAAQGVRALPAVTFGAVNEVDIPHAVVDATHADINLSGSMFEKIYVREIAQVYEWDETANTREQLKEAADKLKALLLQFLGTQSKLMQGGNYGKDMILIDKITPVLNAAGIPAERLTRLKRCLELYNKLRKVWRATWPMEDCPEEFENYELTAQTLGEHLREHFAYFTKWTPYLHKILAHVVDVVNSTPLKTCGGLAAEASEGRNKNFRSDRKHHSRQNLAYELEDNLRWSWLTSSYRLQSLSQSLTKV